MDLVHWLVGAAVPSAGGALAWLWALAKRISWLEFQTAQNQKDITVFTDFMMRRGMVDALKGALKMNSPISVPVETIRMFGQLVYDLRQWWEANKDRFKDDVKNRRLFLELSDVFGDRFVNEICIPQDKGISELETAIVAAIEIINPQPQSSKQTMRSGRQEMTDERRAELGDSPSDKSDRDDTRLDTK